MQIVLLITVIEGLALAIWLFIRDRQKNLLATVLTAPEVRSGDDFNELQQPPDTPRPRWAFVNEWQSEGQPNDRSPMLDAVAESTGSSSAIRSSARRSHQLNFKKWSTKRHD